MVDTDVTGSDGEAVEVVEKMASKGQQFVTQLWRHTNGKGRAHAKKQLTKTAPEMLLSNSGKNYMSSDRGGARKCQQRAASIIVSSRFIC